MKNLLIVVFLLIGSMNVHAEGLSILDAEAINFVGYDGEPVKYAGPRDSGLRVQSTRYMMEI